MDIIEDLYLGNIRPHEFGPDGNAEYKAAVQHLIACEAELKQMLPEEAHGIWLQWSDANTTVIAASNTVNFKKGFRLGVKLTHSCYEE